MKRAIVARVAGLACAVLTLGPAVSLAAASAADRPRFGDVQRALSALAGTDEVVGALGELYVDGRRVGRGSAGSRLLDGKGGTVPSSARYRIGSQTKLMVATVVMQLVEEGRLGVDDKLADVLPETAEQDLVELADEITVRQLIDHTSGVPNYFASGKIDPFDFTTYVKPADLVKLARGVAREQEPGEKASYSNTNYILLGMIVERLTGHTLADELDRRLFTPLGMRRTYLPTKPPEGIKGPHNHGYHPDEQGELHDVDRINASHLWAAGGVVSTAEEVSDFHRAYARGKLLPPGLQEAIEGPKSGGPPDGERLCGGTVNLREVVGGAPGFYTPTYVSADGRLQYAVSVTLTLQSETVRPMVNKAAEAVLCPGR
ncbi:serine hydrolase domain-containing protein [Nonomuraea sp. B5E05]|uniref:serine hydrolase domain-containing protein n=1 Tax=Nonomuraea sp. B5E05 TaxID=3153569 RepID=UPI0032600E38